MKIESYWYEFDPTGIDEIDNILNAVALAGRYFHSTEFWNDEATGDGVVGDTPIEWIQNAANRAAASFKDRIAQ